MSKRLGKFELPNKLTKVEEGATPTYAKFIAEPFEAGYGHTVGNSLRRILLSSLQGAAITAIRTEGALHEFTSVARVPVLANITEFGKTPLFTREELNGAGVRLVLYPLSAFRAMSAAALEVFCAIRRDGTQKSVVGKMQTRADLYEVLNYKACEEKLDELFSKERKP